MRRRLCRDGSSQCRRTHVVYFLDDCDGAGAAAPPPPDVPLGCGRAAPAAASDRGGLAERLIRVNDRAARRVRRSPEAARAGTYVGELDRVLRVGGQMASRDAAGDDARKHRVAAALRRRVMQAAKAAAMARAGASDSGAAQAVATAGAEGVARYAALEGALLGADDDDDRRARAARPSSAVTSAEHLDGLHARERTQQCALCSSTGWPTVWSALGSLHVTVEADPFAAANGFAGCAVRIRLELLDDQVTRLASRSLFEHIGRIRMPASVVVFPDRAREMVVVGGALGRTSAAEAPGRRRARRERRVCGRKLFAASEDGASVVSVPVRAKHAAALLRAVVVGLPSPLWRIGGIDEAAIAVDAAVAADGIAWRERTASGSKTVPSAASGSFGDDGMDDGRMMIAAGALGVGAQRAYEAPMSLWTRGSGGDGGKVGGWDSRFAARASTLGGQVRPDGAWAPPALGMSAAR